MCEDLDRLAAEHDHGNAAAAVRGHDNEIASFQPRGIDDRLMGMLMLNPHRLAHDDAGCFRCADDCDSACSCIRILY
jgi:hypothetical protein